MESPSRKLKSKELADRATARAEARGIPFTLALVEVYREDPDLYEAARRESLWGEPYDAAAGRMGLELVTLSEARGLSRDPAERLAQIAEIRAKGKAIPYSLALSEVKRECPELAHAARLRVLGKREV